MELRYSFMGYNAQDVQETMDLMIKEVKKLRATNDLQANQIKQLTEEINHRRADEYLIREAIVDAKQLSKRLLKEAKEQAANIVSETEQTIEQEFSQYTHSLKDLKLAREQLANYKKVMEEELLSTLQRYREALYQAETATVEQLTAEMNEKMEEMEEVAKLSKQVVVLPDELPSSTAPVIPISSRFMEQNDWDDDMPLYSF